jgi:type 1 glutamine amidotransferase
LAAYERQACRYSLQLFHDAGVCDLDQWVSDFAACDSAYLMHFYRTGKKLAFRSFWREGMPRIEPLAIPEFQPVRWLSRNAGVVV